MDEMLFLWDDFGITGDLAMSVGWSYSPTWTGQRGGDWSQPVRRQLRLPAQNVEWSHSSGLKREVDWPNSLKRRVAWPFSRQPGSSGRDWDNLVGGQRDSPQTFTSKVGGQKYVTDQVGQRDKSKRCCTPVYMHVAQAAALWAAAQQYSSVRPSWWKAAVEARSRERRRRLRRFFLFVEHFFSFFCEQGGGKDNGGCDKELRTGVVRCRYFKSGSPHLRPGWDPIFWDNL